MIEECSKSRAAAAAAVSRARGEHLEEHPKDRHVIRRRLPARPPLRRQRRPYTSKLVTAVFAMVVVVVVVTAIQPPLPQPLLLLLLPSPLQPPLPPPSRIAFGHSYHGGQQQRRLADGVLGSPPTHRRPVTQQQAGCLQAAEPQRATQRRVTERP